MAISPSGLLERARTPTATKAIKYSLATAVAVAVNQVALFVLFGLFHWTARSANILALTIGGIPSYYLNRRWVWGKSGRSHLWREVVPFWALAFTGLVVSTVCVDAAESWALRTFDSRLVQALVVNGASFGALFVLWVGKFVIFNKLIFVTRDPDLQDALEGEVVP